MEKHEENQQQSLKKKKNLFEHNHSDPRSVMLATGQQGTEKEIKNRYT